MDLPEAPRTDESNRSAGEQRALAEVTPPRTLPRAGGLFEDVAGLALALALGATSLPLPFGRDQGLYYYVGREWVLRGAVPYRDVFDHKTPGIYVLHALAVALFGEKQWGIRVVDLVAVLLLGLVVAWLSAPRGEPVARGVRGRSLALVSVLFYGVLNFWDSSQSEIHYALLGCASLACAMKIRRAWLAAALSGALAASALLMKPPVFWFVLAAIIALLVRAREEKAGPSGYVKTLALFGAGALPPLALTFGYFGYKGALPAMRDIVVGANGYYVSHERSQDPLSDVIDSSQGYVAHHAPMSTLLFGAGLAALLLARREGDRASVRRYGYAFALVLCAYASAAMQMKFYLLHWSAMVAPLALLGVHLADTLSRSLRSRRFSARASALAPWLVFLGTYLLSSHARKFVEQQMKTVRYLSGEDSREIYAERFAFPEVHFSYAESEWVGKWLKEHTGPDDTITVRGFQPEVYAVAGRRHSGRFFWTTFLTSPARAYRRADYLAEDLEALRKNPPRYVVARNDPSTGDGPDSVAYIGPLGYEVELTHGRFIIMRRR